MADQAESSPLAPPPSPTLPPDEAIVWATSESSSSSAPYTDLLSLWLSNYTAFPEPAAEEEPLPEVPALLNFDLESSFLDLVDWKAISTAVTAVTQAPVVTQPLWVQLNSPAAGEVDDLPRLALGQAQSPEASNLQLALGIQDPEAFVSPLALGIHPRPAASSKIVTPQASLSPFAHGLQPPPASFGIKPREAPIRALALQTESSTWPLACGIQFPKASISTSISSLAFEIQAPQNSFRTQSAPSSFSSLPPISCTLSMALPLWNQPSVSCTIPMAPSLWNLPPIPCALPMPPPWWNLTPISCTLPMAPSLWSQQSVPHTLPMAPPVWSEPSITCTSPNASPLLTLLPSPAPLLERRSWREFPITQSPPAPGQFLLPYSTSSSVSYSSITHPSHQPYDFFLGANAGCQQQAPVANATVTFSSPNAGANSSVGLVLPTQPAWLQATAQRRSWTSNQPWISTGHDTTLPTPRRPRFLLPTPAATAKMPMPCAPPLTNFRSSLGNMPIGRGVEPVGNHQQQDQQVQPGESSRPRKRSKLAVDSSGSGALHWSHDSAQVAFIAPEPALNTVGKAQPLLGTAIDYQSLYNCVQARVHAQIRARYQREKIKERMKTLQMLIPNVDKHDSAIMLEQARFYIKFLEQQIKLVQSDVDWKLATPFSSNMHQALQ